MNKSSNLFPLFSLLAGGIVLILLSGCAETRQGLWSDVTALKDDLKNDLKDGLKVWSKTNGYKGIKFPSTDKVVPTFQDRQVPVSCRVFAHLLVHIPEGSTGKSLAQAIEAEAMTRGADMLLLGGTRQANDNQGPAFSYYGPAQPYKCRDNWSGWKFAYEEWVSQGEWVAMGYNEWGNPDAHFNSPLIIQAAFLRCPK
ncbi:MAG: hypothetical protein Q3M30_11000 [Candidatus Electrothrix sp. Rat3]|nr:hypothetical protein [Candidatus Electrothrix rattekaaiensis]